MRRLLPQDVKEEKFFTDVEEDSYRYYRYYSIQCHVMLGYHTTAHMRAPVDFGKFARLPLRCGDGFVADVLAKKLPIARDAMVG